MCTYDPKNDSLTFQKNKVILHTYLFSQKTHIN